MKLRVLVLYDAGSTFIGTVKDYLEAFRRFSKHEIYYAVGTSYAVTDCDWDLEAFDVVAIHYSVRIAFGWLSPSFAVRIATHPGLKVLFIQDEYDHTEVARRAIENLGIRVVFTCVPDEEVEKVYPRERFAGVEFVTVLTGYVPSDLPRIEAFARPLRARNVEIGYRGRPLAYWYGNLAREKLRIGEEMKRLCHAHGISEDIAWTEEARIYGDGWYEFLGSCVATLGTESGASVFDDQGSVQEVVRAELARNAGATYEDVWRKHLADLDGKVRMNQVSPRIFEAIALRTALILFEGEYSGVIAADVHYVPLRKDFSNVREVFEKIRSPELIRAMTNRAYADVISSGRFSYERLISLFDSVVDRLAIATHTRELCFAATGQISTVSAYAGPEERERFYRESSTMLGEIVLCRAYQSGIPTTVVLAPPRPEHLVRTSIAKLDSLGPFGRASTIGEVLPITLRSALRFEREGALANALRGEVSGRVAAVRREEPLPHGFSVSFRSALVLRLELLWESAFNYASDLEITCSFHGVEVHRETIACASSERQVVEIPWRVADSIRVTVTGCHGEARLLLRQVRVFAWMHIPDSTTGLRRLARQIWFTLPLGLRRAVRPLVRPAGSGPHS